MTINTRELIEAVSVITENANIRVTIKSSFQASAIVAGATFVGAIVRFSVIVKCLQSSIFLRQWDRLVSSLVRLLGRFGPTIELKVE